MAAAAVGPASPSDSKPLAKINLVFLGEKQTGKTALVRRLMNDTSKDNLYKVDIDATHHTLTVQNCGLQIHLFDSSGKKCSHAVISSYIRHSTVFIVVYDITDPISFEHVPKWIDVVRSVHGKDSIIVLCGNKIELAEKRKISTEEGEQLAKELKVMFIETSAVAGPNVTILFRKVVAALLNVASAGAGANSHESTSTSTESHCIDSCNII